MVSARDGGNGTMNLTTQVQFDREGKLGKVLQVPIWITDSGNPRMSAVRYLPVTIGDKNDNPMFDGTKHIFVYNYQGNCEILGLRVFFGRGSHSAVVVV